MFNCEIQMNYNLSLIVISLFVNPTPHSFLKGERERKLSCTKGFKIVVHQNSNS